MEIALMMIGVLIYIRVWLSQLGLHEQAEKHHKELVDIIKCKHEYKEATSPHGECEVCIKCNDVI